MVAVCHRASRNLKGTAQEMRVALTRIVGASHQ
jgi:hypothetical protein